MKEYIVEIKDLVPETVTVALQADLTISSDIGREIRRTASQFGYYAVLAEKAESRTRRAKLGFDLWRARTEDEIETKMRAETGKGFSKVKDLTRELMKLPKYKAYQLKLDEYEEQARVLKVVARAFEHKKDLVQTQSANRRRELDGAD